MDKHVAFLVCPHCRAHLARAGRTLCCAKGHTYDVARQGYVNLLTGKGSGVHGDTADMIAARVDFLAAGHYTRIADLVASTGSAELARQRARHHIAPTDDRKGRAAPGRDAGQGREHQSRCIVDLGAGTGYYLDRLARRLDAEAPGDYAYGLVAIDVSKHAMRRAAVLHPHLAAVVADTRHLIPVADASAALVIDVFAPREPREIDRILAPDGSVIVVIPRPEHLAELVADLDLLTVDPAKRRATDTKLTGFLELAYEEHVFYTMRPTHRDVRNLIQMGPTAWHRSPGMIGERLHRLPDPVTTTVSLDLLAYRRR